MDRGKVNSCDGGGGVFVGEFDGPDSGAGTKIEDRVGGWWEGGEIEGAVKGEAPQVVLEVWS